MKRRISAVTLVYLIMFSAIFPVQAATNEGYGENQTSLGQFVDSFEDSGNVSVTVDVIRNATLEVIELNYTSGGPSIAENYTLYTEVDANNRFAITDTDIVVSSLSNHDDHHYVVYDYGAGYFTDFTHDLDARGRDDSGSAGNDRMWVWLLANSSDDAKNMVDNNEEFIGLYFQEFDVNDPNSPEITIHEFVNTVDFTDKFEPASRDIWYYFRIIKSGMALNVGIYSTAILRAAGDATDGDYDNLVITLHDDYNFRYIYAVSSHNTGTPTQRIISGDIRNLDIGRTLSGYASEGYFTTVDYLSDNLANGSALAFMVNTSIPENTDIQLQISNDNITWRDHEGSIGDSEDLLGGFETIDLRDLNYSNEIYFRGNLSTSNPAVTPRFYQSRLITTMGNVSAPLIMNVTGSWIEYNASAIDATVGVVDDGDLGSTYFIDGDMFNVSEVVGVPGMTISVNFTGVDPDAESLWVLIYGLYDGNLNHDFDIEVWNFVDSAWVEDNHIPDMVAFDWINSTIYPIRVPNDFLRSGEVRVRLDHEEAGNINHDLFLDYIRLQAFVPLESVAPAEEIFQFFWIVLAIALMLIGIVISKMWFEVGDS